MGRLSRRRGTSGMSSLIVGVRGGRGGVRGLGVREGPLAAGACCMGNDPPLLKPLEGEESDGYTGEAFHQVAMHTTFC